MTALSPPTPSDDERALRLAARAIDGFIEQVRELEAALLGEREAHSATKAENEKLRDVLRRSDEALDWAIRCVGSLPLEMRQSFDWRMIETRRDTLAALSSKESNSE